MSATKPKVRIMYWSEYSEDLPDDCWVIAEKADQAFQASGLRIQRSKDLEFVAYDENDEPIGAIYSSTRQEPASERGGPEDEDDLVYSFDVGVHPKHQGGVVGWMLCKAAIQEAKQVEATMIHNWVINEKMAQMLEKLFGFEHEDSNDDHYVYSGNQKQYSSHMTKWL